MKGLPFPSWDPYRYFLLSSIQRLWTIGTKFSAKDVPYRTVYVEISVDLENESIDGIKLYFWLILTQNERIAT